LIGVYFLQAATPLRLHPDTVILLSIGETVAHGGGYLYHGHRTVFPPGYPTLMALLLRMQLAYVWVIVAINVVFVVIGLLAVYSILRSGYCGSSEALGVCILTLLSFVFVKYSTIPLTDTIFFGVSTCGLALMNHALRSQFSWKRMLGCLALVIVSMWIRRVGVALLPALLYTVAGQAGVRLYVRRLSARSKAAILLGVAAVGAGIAWEVSVTSTLSDFHLILGGHSFLASFPGIVALRLKELGEIAVNLPASAAPLRLQQSLPVIGAVVLLLTFAGAVRRKQAGVLETYFVSYLAVILAWPFYDPRFWLPVIPFLLAYSWLALRPFFKRKLARYGVESYVMLFALLGVATLVSTTELSLSGARFSDLYREGLYHSTYCAAWQCKDPDSSPVSEDGLHVLHIYR
jgi:hypothetical protein